MTQSKQMQDLLRLQQSITAAKKKEEDKKIAVEEIEDTSSDVTNMLPTTYMTATELKLSAKDVTHKTSYLDRLKQQDPRYENIKIDSTKAKRIRSGLTRLTTGSASVVPLRCKGSECSFKESCVTGDTLILMQDGYFKQIKDVLEGDYIYSYNVNTKLIERDKVTKFKDVGEQPVFKITTKYGNSIKVTSDHPMLSINNKDELIWVSLDNTLREGTPLVVNDFDSLYSEDINSVGDCYLDYVVSIIQIGSQNVYDITVHDNQNFIANNFIVHNCPYFLEGVAPVNLSCLVELQLIEYWMEKYQAEFNVEDNSITDMHMIARLCEYDIYDMRVTRYLAETDPTLLTDFISSYDENNNPISNKAASAAFEVKERIDKLRSKTLKELMATREAKAKFESTVSNNVNSVLNMATMKQRLEEVIRANTKVVN